MNQTLGQQDFLGMIDGIIPQLNEAKDPSEVLIKYASDNNLSEEALAHLGKTYNVLKTYSHFGHAKNASDRGKSFKVIDTDDMVKKYATYKVIPTESAPVFMSTPLEGKKQEKKASVYDGYEISERLDNGKHYMPTVNETPINYDTVKVASKKEASEVDRIFQKNEEESNMRFFIGAKKMENEMIASKIASSIKEMSKDEWNNNVWNEFCKVANNHYNDEINVALDYIEGFLDKNLVRFNKQAFVRDSDPDLIHPKYNDMFTGVFEIIDNMQMLKAAANEVKPKQKDNNGGVSVYGALASLRNKAIKEKQGIIVDNIDQLIGTADMDPTKQTALVGSVVNFVNNFGGNKKDLENVSLISTLSGRGNDIGSLVDMERNRMGERAYQGLMDDIQKGTVDSLISKKEKDIAREIKQVKTSPEYVQGLKDKLTAEALKAKHDLEAEQAKDDPEKQKAMAEQSALESQLKQEEIKNRLNTLATEPYAKALTSMGGGLSSGAQNILTKLENAYSTLANKLDAQYAATSQAYANALANKDEFKQKMMNPYVKDDFKAMLDHNVNMLYRTDPIISKQPWTQVKDSVDSILRQAPSITQDRQALKQLLRSQLSLEGGVDLGSVKTMRQIEA